MDSYARLRPYLEDRPCDCATVERLLLVHIMTANPIRCFSCKGHVDPVWLELTNAQVEAVAGWDGVFGSLYRLWLDSGEYELWAKSQLLRRDGQVNVMGMDARAALGSVRPTYYWWFHHSDDEEPQSCPWCSGAVRPAERHGLKQCDKCSVIV